MWREQAIFILKQFDEEAQNISHLIIHIFIH